MGFKRRIKRRFRWFCNALRRHALLVALLTWALLALTTSRHLSRATSIALMPPNLEKDLSHFARNRSLEHYLRNINILIEPSAPQCSEGTILALVTSAPSRWRNRDAIRTTWGRHLTTYFLLGLDGPRINEELTNTYVEAKQHGDIIAYDLLDHYQNLTLKTALMLQWTASRCPQVRFLYKTDDDMLVNPWRLNEVVQQRQDAVLVGYMVNNSVLFRDQYNKWYLPRWLHYDDVVPQYLTGPGYLIRGDHIEDLLQAAFKVPLHNIEDIYFTYSVAVRSLHYNLTHDQRMFPFRPWFSLGCSYFSRASAHSLLPDEIIRAWKKVKEIGELYEKDKDVCGFYEKYLGRFEVWY